MNLSDRKRVLSQLHTTIDRSDLSTRDKRVAKRKLKRRRIQNAALDLISEEAMEEGVITVSRNGDTITTLIDWEGFADFLERILPLLLQLFGGFFD